MSARPGVIVSVSSVARVAGEVVDRRFDAPAGAQLEDVPDHQVGLERVGMVVVERRPLFEPEVVAIPVVAIVLEDGDAAVVDRVEDAADDGRLAGPRPAGDADDDGLHAADHMVVPPAGRKLGFTVGDRLQLPNHEPRRLTPRAARSSDRSPRPGAPAGSRRAARCRSGPRRTPAKTRASLLAMPSSAVSITRLRAIDSARPMAAPTSVSRSAWPTVSRITSAPRRAERDAQSDLVAPLRDEVGDHGIEADRGEEQRQAAEDRHDRRRDTAGRSSVRCSDPPHRHHLEDRLRRVDAQQRLADRAGRGHRIAGGADAAMPKYSAGACAIGRYIVGTLRRLNQSWMMSPRDADDGDPRTGRRAADRSGRGAAGRSDPRRASTWPPSTR